MDSYYLWGFLLLLVFIYPYFLYPISLRFFNFFFKEKVLSCEKDKDYTYALVFCAYNEERSLKSKINNVRELKKIYPNLEIYAYSDASTDGTNKILREASDVINVTIGEEQVGKATGMGVLVGKVTADIVIFTDANVILDNQAIAKMEAYFCDTRISTVAGTLLYTNQGDTSTSYVGGAYWKLEEKIKKLESLSGSTVGADGSIFAVRKSSLVKVPPDLLDDFVSSYSPIFTGQRIVSANDVIAYEELITNSGKEFKRKIRIGCRAYRTHQYLWEDVKRLKMLDIFKYVSHKILRWFGAIPLVLASVFITMGFVSDFGLLITMLLLIMFFSSAYLFGISKAPLSHIIEILSGVFGTFFGVCQAIFGNETYQIWTPSQRGK